MDKEQRALTLRDNARTELLQIRDIETGIEYLNNVKTIEVWARCVKKDAELMTLASEQKLRTGRILGDLIRQGQERGEIAKAGDNQHAGTEHGAVPKTLDDVGISHKQSSTFQKLASIPEDQFEAFIEAGKQKVDDAVAELSYRGALRLAGMYKQSYSNNTRFTGYTNLFLSEAVRDLMYYKEWDESTAVAMGLQLLVNSVPIDERKAAKHAREANKKATLMGGLKLSK